MIKLKNQNLLRQECLINGEWVKAQDSVLEIVNPFDNSKIGTVPKLDKATLNLAVEKAQEAFKTWSKLMPLERSAVLMRWHQLILDNIDDLALIMTSEQGKPLAEAKGEILNGVSYLPWFSEQARRACGEVIPSPWPNKRPISYHQPVGVVAAITPWNFPSSLLMRKLAPALAAGCTVIAKPAKETPFSALALGYLAVEAGIPKGVLNIVTGDSRVVGDVFTTHPLIRKVTFTGSTAVGKTLLAQCAGTVKRTSMELGGNAPYIVFADADLERAASYAIACKFRNAGQTCISANRIFVEKSVVAEFTKKFVEKVKTLKLGNGVDPQTTCGPLIHEQAVKDIETLLKKALEQGAKLVIGGKRSELGGTFFEPTVLSNVTPENILFQEEIFGPIAPIYTFETEEEVIKLANAVPVGLAAYVFTQNLRRSWLIAEALEFGLVGVNEVALTTPEAPFGGMKESGMGKEGSTGGLEDYQVTKYALMGL
ncbi:NAD-dependent succinate-semialdehyde dehydrogenase [Desulfovibrio litoralis]|uniref:Succinate-semialdehyde dehydrogenase / glutarate-semialdehyde dehydrogenase n=1 Tax=Desulfovibrio litoralis DSM 11393 TaxID=1121455 RepID=A0A1M7SVN3_9BACT|nr:NAD-dependent succinate-semialdehyde dehydrogenase [Desulfovibrio litoralis]SHN62627.1 succinate-semialdehyde dehydrogenase / glutarate-semialdehyde dehydrogenase [Desulfovibrio litoralis DSM 11393]